MLSVVKNLAAALVLGGAVCGLAACSGTATAPTGSPPPTVFTVSTRQIPLQPVYGRLRWVRPGQVMPARQVESSAPLILPVMQWDLGQVTVQEAAAALAGAARYRLYCSTLVAHQPVNLMMVGTIDEAAAELTRQTGVQVVVDHQQQELRVLGSSYVAPAL